MSAADSEFAAAQREARGDALTFDLGGRAWTCRKRLPFGLIANLAAKMQDDAGVEVLDAFRDLVVFAVCKAERDELRALLIALPEDDDDETTIEFRDLARAAQSIVERATGSPFDSGSGLPGSPSPNGATLPARASSAGSTSVPFRRVEP